jgi:hypothetical protein
VYTAQWLADSRREDADHDAYAALVSLMHIDCEASLDENRVVDPNKPTGPLRQSAFLQASAFQNTLLLRFMNRTDLEALMKDMSDSAMAEAAVNNVMRERAMGFSPPSTDLASGLLRQYLESQQRLCHRLAQANKK